MKRLLPLMMILLFLCAGCQATPAKPQPTEPATTAAEAKPVPPQSDLKVYCFAAGKADAFLFYTDNSAVLIDTGESGFGKTIVQKCADLGINELDCLILTHFDKDHVGGAKKVIDSLKVDRILQSNSPKESDAYAKYLEAIERKAITPETVRSVLQFNADGVQYTVDPPAREIYEDSASNNSSLVTTVTHGDVNMLFLGDAEDARLQEYLAKKPRPCQVVKLPHHGRWHSALNALMAQTKPAYVIATSSSDELEDDQTVKLVNDSGAQLFLTRQAPVEITSSAQGLQVRYTDF